MRASVQMQDFSTHRRGEDGASRRASQTFVYLRFLPTFVFLLLLFLPAAAHAQEGGTSILNFYSDPTDRHNILVPAGWENVSTDGVRLVNDVLGAQIDAFALRGDVEARLAEWAPEAIDAPELELLQQADVQLTTGEWTQRLYKLPASDTRALTVFSQRIDDVEYVITFSAREPVFAFVVPLDSPLADAAGASAVVDAGAAALGLDATREGELTDEQVGATTWYRQGMRVGADDYLALVRRSGELTADIIIGPAGAVTPDDAVALTVVRDFFLTPETTNYLVLGLVAAFAVLGVFVVSLIVRRRNLRRDEAVLREVMAQEVMR